MERTDPRLLAQCSRFRVDPELIAAFIQVESSGDQYAFRYEPNFRHVYKVAEFARIHRIPELSEQMGQKTSFGLMQIMGGTARWLGFIMPLPLLFDPSTNLEYGIRYLLTLQRRYDSVEDQIAAYNAGSARKDASGLYENQRYVDKVRNVLSSFRKG
jgi:soluble lytic murein transglycosylase-like protein